MIQRTCNNCGRVAFGMTRTFAETEAASFNKYIDAADERTREMFGHRRSSVADYESCLACGGPHTNFRDALPGDAPNGATMSSIIVE